MPTIRTIVLSEVAYQRIQTYATFAGLSIEDAASDAITEWMNSTGDLVVEALQKTQRASAAKTRLTIASSAGSHTSAKSLGNSLVSRRMSSDEICLQNPDASISSAAVVADFNGDDKPGLAELKHHPKHAC